MAATNRADLQVSKARYMPPALPAYHVSRKSLNARVQNRMNWRIVLVQSPVGYGKTAFLCEWHRNLAARNANCTGWLSLDQQTRDVRVLLGEVAMVAIRQWGAEADDRLVYVKRALLQSETTGFTPLGNWLYDAFGDDENQYTLFVDNAEKIDSSAFSQFLSFWTKYVPQNIHLVMAGSYMPVDLVDYETWNQISVIRKADLLTDDEEAKEIVHALYGKEVSSATFDAIAEMSHGWIAGFRLFGDVLVRADDPHDVSKATCLPFADLYFASYLDQTMSDEVLEFMTQISFLERFNAELCDCVLSSTGSDVLIAELVEKGCFIEEDPKQKGVYSFDAVMSVWLQNRLFSLYSTVQIQELSHRARAWLVEHGQEDSSIKYMLMESGTDLIEAFLRATSFGDIDLGEDLLAQICAMSTSKMLDKIDYILLIAWIHASGGRYMQMETWLDKARMILVGDLAERDADTVKMVELTISFLNIASYQLQGRFIESVSGYSNILERYDDTLPLAFRCVVHHDLAEAFEGMGEYDQARNHYRTGEMMARMTDLHFYVDFCRFALAMLDIRTGDLRSAKDLCSLAIGECSQESTLYGALHYCLAKIQIDQYEFDAARTSLDTAFAHLSHYKNIDMLYEAHAVKARFLSTQGLHEEAESALFRLTLQVGGMKLPRSIVSAIYFDWGMESIRLGDPTNARIALPHLLEAGSKEDAITSLQAELLKGCILELEGKEDESIKQALKIVQRASENNLFACEVDGLILAAIDYEKTGDKAKAAGCIKQALSKGALIESMGVFLREGEAVAPILRRVVAHSKATGLAGRFMKKVLCALNELYAPAMDREALLYEKYGITEREREILSLLRAGYSRREIAESLCISMNTAKAHFRNIFVKLGVNSSEEAIKLIEAI